MNRGNGLPAFAFRQAVMVPDLEQRTSQRTQRYNLTKGKRDDSLVKQVSHKHSSQTHADYKHDSTANSPFKPSVYWSPSWTCASKTKSKQLFHFLGYHSSSLIPAWYGQPGSGAPKAAAWRPSNTYWPTGRTKNKENTQQGYFDHFCLEHDFIFTKGFSRDPTVSPTLWCHPQKPGWSVFIMSSTNSTVSTVSIDLRTANSYSKLLGSHH